MFAYFIDYQCWRFSINFCFYCNCIYVCHISEQHNTTIHNEQFVHATIPVSATKARANRRFHTKLCRQIIHTLNESKTAYIKLSQLNRSSTLTKS